VDAQTLGQVKDADLAHELQKIACSHSFTFP
jgi:hypothetical protein